MQKLLDDANIRISLNLQRFRSADQKYVRTYIYFGKSSRVRAHSIPCLYCWFPCRWWRLWYLSRSESYLYFKPHITCCICIIVLWLVMPDKFTCRHAHYCYINCMWLIVLLLRRVWLIKSFFERYTRLHSLKLRVSLVSFSKKKSELTFSI